MSERPEKSFREVFEESKANAIELITVEKCCLYLSGVLSQLPPKIKGERIIAMDRESFLDTDSEFVYIVAAVALNRPEGSSIFCSLVKIKRENLDLTKIKLQVISF